jgi:hypothetical protein
MPAWWSHAAAANSAVDHLLSMVLKRVAFYGVASTLITEHDVLKSHK